MRSDLALLLRSVATGIILYYLILLVCGESNIDLGLVRRRGQTGQTGQTEQPMGSSPAMENLNGTMPEPQDSDRHFVPWLSSAATLTHIISS
jgi:hypothetical protein